MSKKINSLYSGLGIALGVLSAVALSSKADTTNPASPTYFQIIIPYAGALIALVIALIIVCVIVVSSNNARSRDTRALLEDRQRERLTQAEDRQREREAWQARINQLVALNNAGWYSVKELPSGEPLLRQFDERGAPVSPMLPASHFNIKPQEFEAAKFYLADPNSY